MPARPSTFWKHKGCRRAGSISIARPTRCSSSTSLYCRNGAAAVSAPRCWKPCSPRRGSPAKASPSRSRSSTRRSGFTGGSAFANTPRTTSIGSCTGRRSRTPVPGSVEYRLIGGGFALPADRHQEDRHRTERAVAQPIEPLRQHEVAGSGEKQRERLALELGVVFQRLHFAQRQLDRRRVGFVENPDLADLVAEQFARKLDRHRSGVFCR